MPSVPAFSSTIFNMLKKENNMLLNDANFSYAQLVNKKLALIFLKIVLYLRQSLVFQEFNVMKFKITTAILLKLKLFW